VESVTSFEGIEELTEDEELRAAQVRVGVRVR